MEQNPPVMAKKVWNLMRVMFFMLKKGISKSRFFADLNMVMKRSKIAGKSLNKILFHHYHHHHRHNHQSATFNHHPHHLQFLSPPPSEDEEFSCTTTPQHQSSLSNTHAPPSTDVCKKLQTHAPPSPVVYKKLQTHVPPSAVEIEEIVMADPGMVEAVEMLARGGASFGRSPVGKELRITDSPFPLSNGDEDGQVDEMAEKFILRFYDGLKREK